MRLFFRDASIRQKLTGIMMLSCGIILLLASTTFIVSEVFSFRRALLDKTSSLAKIVGANAVIPLTFHDRQTAGEILASLSAEPHIRQAYLFDRRNNPFAQYVSPHPGFAGPAPPCEKIAEEVQAASEQHCYTLEHLAVYQPVYHRGERIGLVYLQADLGALYARLTRFAFGGLLIMGIFTALAYLLADRLQRLISAPILQLAATMKTVSEGQDFTLRAEGGANDEVGRLIDGFNEMLSHLEVREAQLQHYRQGLEEKVARRTGELQEAYEELGRTVLDLEQAKRAAEAANEGKSRFLATISHEIRTPMVGVLGMTELLAQTELDDRQRALTETAHRSGEALLAILNDILDFSKIEAGKLELETIDFDLRRVLDHVVELYAQVALRKDLGFDCRIDSEIPTALCGDPVRLRQVLLNLAGNAVKFTEHGEVGIRVALLDEDGDAVLIRFEVRDTGIGIDEGVREGIFDAFAQADGSTTRRFGGTGLGLAIVRDLVALMGGRVEVESEPGKGSTFAFVLRLAKGSTPQESAYLEGPPSVAEVAGRILVAEDSRDVQRLLQIHLETRGFQVKMVASGREAVDRLAEEVFDLVLMDYSMPEMDGPEATRRIREAGVRTPIIALSAHTGREHSDAFREAGVDDYLNKPFKQQQLYDVLDRWLAG